MNKQEEKLLREFVRKTFEKLSLKKYCKSKKRLCCKSKKLDFLCGRL
jgi:hypothetical protein